MRHGGNSLPAPSSSTYPSVRKKPLMTMYAIVSSALSKSEGTYW
jgi:hypothetical protein